MRFAGYAAVFDVPDRGGDVIRAGAFGARVRRVPLLWQHRGQPVGVIEAIGEDARGLRVTGRVDAPELAALVALGAVNGLSFGYRTVTARQGRWREIERLELCEVSLVARPMQKLARVHAVEQRQLKRTASGEQPDEEPEQRNRGAAIGRDVEQN